MPDHGGEVLLRVERLCQYFKNNKAVDDVSFDIKKGEVFGLVGESGCGKTTTGRSIMKLYDITSGSIYFKGKRVAAGTLSYKNAIEDARAEMRAAAPERREALRAFIAKQREEIASAVRDHTRGDRIYADELAREVDQKYRPLLAAAEGAEAKALQKRRDYERGIAQKQRFITQIQMIFQDPIASLDPRMTVFEIISEGLRIRGETDKRHIEERVFEVLEMVGLVREHAGRYPHEFSGGQRQRIGVARAIVMNPELIIADEPVSALDVSIQAQVINLLDDLRRKLGLTILFIAHDLSVVKYFSDRIGVMYYGKLVELAPSDELFARPLHPYTRSLLSAIPLPDPCYERQRRRIKYEPLAEHDYSVDKPAMREVTGGHFVYCNAAEFEAHLAQLAQAPMDL
ncbi:MAG: ABC transporter ATP-binding protein [Clostridiales bacterium]|nr:ABC transporter ATP-binding protein [Clostridiales bacterium]